MAANEDAMGNLHDQVAKVLTLALKGQELPAYTDEDGKEQPAGFIPPSAAIIQAATKFLKDNNITCVPSKDNALGELEEQMRRRQERRASRADLRLATEDGQFLNGTNL